jgi:hypothetical protein
VTRKDGWEESTKGPDWIDAESLMRAIGSLHSGHVAFTASPRTIGGTGGLVLTVGIIFDRLPGSSLPAMVAVDGAWPSKHNRTLAGEVLRLLYGLDVLIGKTYENKSLWD